MILRSNSGTLRGIPTGGEVPIFSRSGADLEGECRVLVGAPLLRKHPNLITTCSLCKFALVVVGFVADAHILHLAFILSVSRRRTLTER
eukprot:7463346-Pyramimonas_sp.AAC.2